MSDDMYDTTPLPSGKAYTIDGWKEYAIHDDIQVFGFFGDYRWLSNFEMSTCFYRGDRYSNTEAAYQAAKILPQFREAFCNMGPAASKKASRAFSEESMAPRWDERAKKISVMQEVTFSKYLLSPTLRKKLIETGDRTLVESNHWHDTMWGYDVHTKSGENMLGRILMMTRSYFQHELK